eukprot:UN14533
MLTCGAGFHIDRIRHSRSRCNPNRCS